MDWAAVANFGLPGIMLAFLFLVVKAWLASQEKIATGKLENERERIKVEDKKADAIVNALGMLTTQVNSHHTLDIQSHAALSNGIAEIRGKLDEAIGWQERTPVENPQRSQVYGLKRPGTRNEDR